MPEVPKQNQTNIPNDDALIFADESTAGSFVTAGLFRLPSPMLDEALKQIGLAKQARGVPSTTQIHCRILFHPDAKRKSEFAHVGTSEIDQLLMELVFQT